VKQVQQVQQVPLQQSLAQLVQQALLVQQVPQVLQAQLALSLVPLIKLSTKMVQTTLLAAQTLHLMEQN
jgi:hypothetical protein